jgi:hypothetical protein
MSDDWSSYIRFRDDGSSAQELWNCSRTDGLKFSDSIRMIRSVFDLTLEEAKEVMIQAERLGTSLEEYQDRIVLPALEEAERMERVDLT